jgi:hypothetical protein
MFSGNAYKFLSVKTFVKSSLGRHRHNRKDNTNITFTGMDYGHVK